MGRFHSIAPVPYERATILTPYFLDVIEPVQFELWGSDTNGLENTPKNWVKCF